MKKKLKMSENFICEKCETSFSRKYNLRRHLSESRKCSGNVVVESEVEKLKIQLENIQKQFKELQKQLKLLKLWKNNEVYLELLHVL